MRIITMATGDLLPQVWTPEFVAELRRGGELTKLEDTGRLPDPRVETSGAVVNVGSIGGLRGKAWQAAYSAAEAGVTSLTRSLA